MAATNPYAAPQAAANPSSNEMRLFWACFAALITTAFGFIVRAMIMDEWRDKFNLTETQKGEIFGVGLWPFAISIVLFSLFIDKIGYGRAMVFAFVCHLTSVAVTLTAKGYWGLYIGNLIVALGNGTVEAVINPVVATMFSKDKTKWLNILHAGWPGGLVLGGLITLAMGNNFGWEYKVGLIILPTIVYGFLMLQCKFPVNERVAAGVSDKDMLKELGFMGALLVSTLMVFEVSRVFQEQGLIFKDWSESSIMYTKWGISIGIAAAFGLAVQSLGRPMFAFLLLIMIPLATTELGTDSWITGLMEPEMAKLQLNAGWVLVYTSLIMMILRFFAGPIVHKLSPLGLLLISSLVAAAGLVALSKAEGMMILAAATLYGFGKTFFWPTMLGVVAEQFPKGGALTLNTCGGVGMLGVGVVGAVLLGSFQAKETSANLNEKYPAIAKAVLEEKNTVLGKIDSVVPEKKDALPAKEKAEVTEIENSSKKGALFLVASLPLIMFVCYLLLWLYFQSRGGYKPVSIDASHH